ncbi:MAG: type III-A CRISPR-associated RAMP protein Csm5, partial [Aggregatilineales bacterium]
MKADYRLFSVSVSLVTPLHIGSGRELLHNYDYAIKSGKTWRINESVLLDTQNVDDPKLVEQISRSRPAELLSEADFDPQNRQNLFRYIINGAPRSRIEGAQLREQLKDPFDRPYLPGSSLKGAIRSALLWHAWQTRNLRAQTSRLNRRREWAGQDYERELMGDKPNTSLMRALHVSDSRPVDIARLVIINARVMNRIGEFGSPIELEAVAPDTVFQGVTLKIDLALFSEWARRRDLRLQGREWLEGLADIVNRRAKERAQREAEWYRAIPQATLLADFYTQIARAKLKAGQFLIELGWGTGWESKTFGSRLLDNKAFMERVIDDYRLAKGRREHGDPFPKSRRVVMRFARDAQGNVIETPARPLGWALVQLAEAGAGV